MYNLISKLAYIIIAPENWILLFLIWLFLSGNPKTKKKLAIVTSILVLVFGNEFIFTTLVNRWQPKPVTFAEGAVFEAGIVLGGASSFDKFGRGYFNGASDRFIQACILYKTKKIKRIIISGGSNADNQPKDAVFQYKRMVELGIPPTDIIIEDSSRTTFENAIFSKIKMDNARMKPPFVLITSAMHVPRAQRVFAKAGIPVVAFPCNYHVLERNFTFTDYFIPKTYIIFSWSTFLKEVAGIIGYTVFKKA